MRRMMLASAGALVMMAACSAGAAAQAWIGQIAGDMAARAAEEQCMMGTAHSAAELAEARIPSTAAMQAYWTAARSGAGRSIPTAFHPGSKSRWRHGAVEFKGLALVSVVDPVARKAATLGPEATGFVRSGDSGSAQGIWTARDAGGAPVGSYLAGFRRVAGVWKLSTLELMDGSAAPTPLAQYCHKPGDVAAYRASAEADEARRAAKKARKDAERAVRRD